MSGFRRDVRVEGYVKPLRGARTGLLDALLNLAPGVIQCIPALSNHWRRWREAQRENLADPASADAAPMSGGGMTDSCYMWRRDSAMNRVLTEAIARGPDPKGAR